MIMNKKFTKVYAILCTILMALGFIIAFLLAWKVSVAATVACICGLLLGFIFAPLVHELGHYTMGKSVGFSCVYFKAFCFQIVLKDGKYRFSFVLPFAPDQTQMLPTSSENMAKRARVYTLGGLIFSGGFLALALLVALLTNNFVVWGILPYTTYLFLLNLPATEYASGKTDILVYQGIKEGADEEKCMLSAMEIQGKLYEGKRFSTIPEELYFDLPQLCEEQPLYAVILDLRYRYYLDKGDLDHAADCLNRLAMAQEYLSNEEIEKIAAELTYMHAISGNLDAAEESAQLCKFFLAGESVTAKRVLAAYSLAVGEPKAAGALKSQARTALQREKIIGVKRFEENLLARIKTI